MWISVKNLTFHIRSCLNVSNKISVNCRKIRVRPLHAAGWRCPPHSVPLSRSEDNTEGRSCFLRLTCTQRRAGPWLLQRAATPHTVAPKTPTQSPTTRTNPSCVPVSRTRTPLLRSVNWAGWARGCGVEASSQVGNVDVARRLPSRSHTGHVGVR